MNAYLRAWTKYAVFAGRASRDEYWTFFFIHVLVAVGFRFFDGDTTGEFLHPTGLTTTIYLLASLLPWWSLSVRRFHDIGYSGGWFALVLLPGGLLMLMIFMAFPSQPVRNEHGVPAEDPSA